MQNIQNFDLLGSSIDIDSAFGSDGVSTNLLILVEGGKGDDVLNPTDAPAGCKEYGHAGDDTISGSSFSDKMYGGKGDDTLIAGEGNWNDTLIGGKGDDHFVFLGPTDFEGSYTKDTVQGWHPGDTFDFSQFDGNLHEDGFQHLTLVDDFTGAGGEIRVHYDKVHHETDLQTDVDGNGVADYQVEVTGKHLDITDWLVL